MYENVDTVFKIVLKKFAAFRITPCFIKNSKKVPVLEHSRKRRPGGRCGGEAPVSGCFWLVKTGKGVLAWVKNRFRAAVWRFPPRRGIKKSKAVLDLLFRCRGGVRK
jgi:hypothetical protein